MLDPWTIVALLLIVILLPPALKILGEYRQTVGIAVILTVGIVALAMGYVWLEQKRREAEYAERAVRNSRAEAICGVAQGIFAEERRRANETETKDGEFDLDLFKARLPLGKDWFPECVRRTGALLRSDPDPTEEILLQVALNRPDGDESNQVHPSGTKPSVLEQW